MEVPCYQAKLLRELNVQRKRDYFCDCSILVEGRVFKAHRNVLFAGSGYFRALLVHYLQDTGQLHSTASLEIVTADAFSIILDFLYSGRLALNRANVIEVMSAASYLQMTDLVHFCKEYIRSSLDICNKEKDAQKEAPDRATQTGSPGGGAGATTDRGSESARAPSAERTAPPPPGPGGRTPQADCSLRAIFLPARDGPKGEDPGGSSSLSTAAELTPELLNPKIEYDPNEDMMVKLPDEDMDEEIPDSKDLVLFPGVRPSDHGGLTPHSPCTSSKRSPYGSGVGSLSGRHYTDMLARSEGSSSPAGDRGDPGRSFDNGPPSAIGGGGGLEDGLEMGGSSVLGIQTDWFVEDTGDCMLMPVKLHKCPFCQYTTSRKGIMTRHIRSHTGERPFSCPLCVKTFIRQEHMRSHALRRHRHITPPACKCCRKEYEPGDISEGLNRFGICGDCSAGSALHQAGASGAAAPPPQSSRAAADRGGGAGHRALRRGRSRRL